MTTSISSKLVNIVLRDGATKNNKLSFYYCFKNFKQNSRTEAIHLRSSISNKICIMQLQIIIYCAMLIVVAR